MPFPLIPAALAVCFLLMWALIACMIFRDGQLAVRRDRDWDGDGVRVTSNRAAPAVRFTAIHKRRRRIEPTARVAS
jgi:hypothetical protein